MSTAFLLGGRDGADPAEGRTDSSGRGGEDAALGERPGEGGGFCGEVVGREELGALLRSEGLGESLVGETFDPDRDVDIRSILALGSALLLP